jgi:hypothetical protein
MQPTPGDLLDLAAAAVMPLSVDPQYVLRVDARFDPFSVRVARAEYRPHELRDRTVETEVPLSAEIQTTLERTLRAFDDATRTETRWHLSVTLTVYCDGQFSFGATVHSPAG